MTFTEVTYQCQWCGKEYEGRRQTSLSIVRRRCLDFKPYGFASAPVLPSCPHCRFAGANFSEVEMEKLKAAINKNNIFDDFPGMPPYFYLAKEYEILGMENEKILDGYIRAVWQSDFAKKNSFELFVKISSIAMEYMDALGAFSDASSDNYHKYQLIRLDFFRRQKKFDQALALLDEIEHDAHFPSSEENVILLEYQRELIDKRDIDTHRWPRTNKAGRERAAFFAAISASISVITDNVTKELIDGLHGITALKESKLHHKILHKLPIVSGSLFYRGALLDTLVYLKSKNVEATITITNGLDKSQKEICLSELAPEDINRNNLQQKIYTMFHYSTV